MTKSTWYSIKCLNGIVLYLICSGTAIAANECRVQINFKNNKNENINEVKNVNKGNAADINLSGIRFVKNLKNHEVKFLFQPGTIGVNDITLGQGQRSPAVGYFITPPTLQKVICLNDDEVTAPATPEAVISAMRSNGINPSNIALELKNRFNLTKKRTLRLLNAAGFSLEEAAEAVKAAFSIDGDALMEVVAGALKESGFDTTRIARRLNRSFRLKARRTIKILHKLGFPLDDIVKATRAVFSINAKDLLDHLKRVKRLSHRAIARSLKKSGYNAVDIAEALNSVQGLNREQIGDLLTSLAFTAAQIQQALDQVFGAVKRGALETQRAVTLAGTSAMHETGKLIGTRSNIHQVRNDAGIILPPTQAFPLRYGGNRISINGAGLGGITSVRGFPEKALVRVISRSPNWLYLEVNVRPQVRANTRGSATLVAGKEVTALSFSWMVAGKSSAPPLDLVPITGRNAGSHILNYYIVSETDVNRIEIRTGGSDQNPQYTQFYRVIPEGHCSGLAYPGVSNNGPRVSQAKRQRVSDFEWGVAINNQNYENTLASAFTVRLQRGQQTLDKKRIRKNMSFGANARKVFTTRRTPPLSVRVYRIGNDSPNKPYKGCWSQEDPGSNRTRHDNDVVVEIDVNNEIEESSSGERNNAKPYIR